MLIDRTTKHWLCFLLFFFLTLFSSPLLATPSSNPSRLTTFFTQDVRSFFEQDIPIFFKHRLPASFKLAGDKVFAFFSKDIPHVFQHQVKNFFQGQVADVINEKFIDKVIDVFDPQLQDLVQKELETVKVDALASVHEVVSAEVSTLLNWKYPGESIGIIREKIYLPLKHKAHEIISHFYHRYINVLAIVITDTKEFIIRDIKNALKLYFGVGPKREHRLVKVNLSCGGLCGFFQRKLEQMHADILGELLPSLEAYIKGLRPKLLAMIKNDTMDILMTVLGMVSHSALVKKAVTLIVEKALTLVDGKIENELAEIYAKGSEKLNSAFRKSLYQPFWFLRPHIDSVQAQISAS